MPAIAISTIQFSPIGSIYLDLTEDELDLGSYARRVSRTATLDGGVYVIDNGYTDADRTVTITLTPRNKTTHDSLITIIKSFTSFLLFLPDGAYKAVPERLALGNGSSSISFLLVGIGKVVND